MIDYEYLSLKAKNIRRNVVEMIYNAKSGHPGGSLSSRLHQIFEEKLLKSEFFQRF